MSKEIVTWQHDAFDRKAIADYLTVAISSHFQPGQVGMVTAALDADWGAGKTFFVKEWMVDLKAAGHPVIYFDVWENDIGDEPSVALMAAILDELDEWKQRLPRTDAAVAKASSLTTDAIKSLRQAVLPAAAVLAKGVLKKVTGVAVDEMVDAFCDEDNNVDSSSESLVGEALDKFFSQALVSHRERANSLNSFRSSIVAILELISSKAHAQRPCFIFIDELDRCRPSYALKLLEEVKHIFAISGVAYIVSTNINQLQNSVKKEYGADFDGRRYLRRLFHREYVLPAPDQDSLVRFAMERVAVVAGEELVAGLPAGKANNAARSWALISKAMFPTDLRMQLQAADILGDVIRVVNGNGPVHFIWLAYLAALYVTDVAALRRIASNEIPEGNRHDFLVATLRENPLIEYAKQRVDPYEKTKLSYVSISHVLNVYYSAVDKDPQRLSDIAYSPSQSEYPRSLLRGIVDGMGGRQYGSEGSSPHVAYADLVLSAGRLAG